jgi:hypothetical protein
MNRNFSIIGLVILISACSSDPAGAPLEVIPLADVVPEAGVGTFTTTKVLTANSPELQAPANCPELYGSVDPRLKVGMVFREKIRLMVSGAGSMGLTSQISVKSILPNEITSDFQLLQVKNISTLKVGVKYSQVCSKTDSNMGCEMSPKIQVPNEILKYNSCSLHTENEGESKYALGRYTLSNGTVVNAIYMKYVRKGQVTCSDTNENMGEGRMTYVDIVSAEPIAPTFRFNCRTNLSFYSKFEAGGRMLRTTLIENEFVK